jgi:hypothetical protein
MKRLFLLGLVCVFSSCLQAQVVDTTVCDVIKNPTSFNGKIVRIKGTVTADFDQFVVKNATCDERVNSIWLSYPEGSKAKSGPVAILELQPAANFTGTVPAVTRTPVTLDKSKDFKQFDSLLAAPAKLNGMYLGCGRYEVSATLVGRLDGVDAKIGRDKSGKIVSISGFGNMNQFSARLVLQSVSDVTSKEIDYSTAVAASKEESTAAGPGSADPVEANRKAAAAYGVTTDPGKDLIRCADAFPKPKENSGVIVFNGNLNEAAAKDDAKGAKESPDGVLYNVGFNTNRLSGDAIVRAYAHMGKHVADLRTPEKGNENLGIYDLEFRAWSTTIMGAVAYGQKTLTLPGGIMLWNNAWATADRNNFVEKAIKGFLRSQEILSR